MWGPRDSAGHSVHAGQGLLWQLFCKGHPFALSPTSPSPQATTPKLSSFKQTRSKCVKYIVIFLFLVRVGNNHKHFTDTFRISSAFIIQEDNFLYNFRKFNTPQEINVIALLSIHLHESLHCCLGEAKLQVAFQQQALPLCQWGRVSPSPWDCVSNQKRHAFPDSNPETPCWTE